MLITKTNHSDGAEIGFTLLEVMMTMVLLSILILGTSSLFTRVNEIFFQLNLKQKAVFVLNGEMAREYASLVHDGIMYPVDIAAPDGTIFDSDNEHARFLLTINSVSRTFVWLDQERSIIAELVTDSAEPPDPNYDILTDDSVNVNTEDCYFVTGVAKCKELELSLKFPYRLINNDSGLTLGDDMDNPREIRLKTIVGGR